MAGDDDFDLLGGRPGVWLTNAELRAILRSLWLASEAAGSEPSPIHFHIVDVTRVIYRAIEEGYRGGNDD